MSLRNALLAACVVLAGGVATSASAAETTSTFQSSASVPASCSLVVNTANRDSVRFGTYDPVVANATTGAQTRNTTAIISVTCNRQAAPVSVNIGEGLNPSAGSSCATPLRNMVSATGGRLPYTLYLGAGPAPGPYALGCAENNHHVLSFATVQKTSFVVAGRIDPGLDAPVGDYSDTVMASLIF